MFSRVDGYAEAFAYFQNHELMSDPCGWLIQAAQYSTLAFRCGFRWPKIVSLNYEHAYEGEFYDPDDTCEWMVGRVHGEDEAAYTLVYQNARCFLTANGWLEVAEDRYFHSQHGYKETLEALEIVVEASRLGAAVMEFAEGGAA